MLFLFWHASEVAVQGWDSRNFEEHLTMCLENGMSYLKKGYNSVYECKIFVRNFDTFNP